MKAIAMKPILYKAGTFSRIAEKGEEIEMDNETFQWRKSRGEVKEVMETSTDEDDLIVSDGLPALDEVPSSTRKKKNGA